MEYTVKDLPISYEIHGSGSADCDDSWLVRGPPADEGLHGAYLSNPGCSLAAYLF